jgi:phosphosulfolactate phosphohydrolase-like enzyme
MDTDMTSTLIRGGAAMALAALAVLAPTVAHASVQETRVFTGFDSGNSPKEAKRGAEKAARQHALVGGFLNEQCVLLYANSSRLAPGYYWGDAAINCTR